MVEVTKSEASRIVVGVDGSPESILALKWANTMAPALACTIDAVTTWHIEVVFGPYSASDWDPEPMAREVLAEALVQAFGDEPPAGLTTQVLRGQTAQVLIGLSESAQMLVVGSRGRGGFTGLLLGSVSATCAEHASCPVLVVHAAKKPGAVAPYAETARSDTRGPADGA